MTKYAKYTKVGEAAQYYPEREDGWFDGTPVSTLPDGAVVSRSGVRVGQPYLPTSVVRVINFAQFGTGGSQAIHKFSVDFRPANISHEQWQSYGPNMLSQWISDQGTADSPGSTYPFSGVPDNKKFSYNTESVFGYEGHDYYQKPFSDIEVRWNSVITRLGPGAHWVANIETSNYWVRDAYSGGGYGGWGSHWGAWDDVKNQPVILESGTAVGIFGPSCTMEALFANSGAQQAEQAVRRANRISLMLIMAKQNGAYVAYGSSIYQGEPHYDNYLGTDRFRDEGDADVTHINSGAGAGNYSNGGRSYTGLTGSFYKHETFHLNYHYYFTFDRPDLTDAQFNAITTYPDLWPYVKNRHPVAREIAHWLANTKRLKDVHNGVSIPSIRMHELFYEDNFARCPAAMNIPLGDGGLQKVRIPPYLARLFVIVQHFLEGEWAGSGFHIFQAEGAPNQGIIWHLADDGTEKSKEHNHHMHTVEALFAAHRDMETVLDKIAGTTLTTDLEISVGNTGTYETINGATAYALNSSGGQGTMKPCGATRHKMTDEGLYVIFIFGMDQGWSTTRTDSLRIPGVGNGNTIKVTYKGPDVQLFEILFPNGVNNTEFEAKSITSWSRAGYGGLINNA